MDNLRDNHNAGTVPTVHQTMLTHLAMLTLLIVF